VPQQDVRAARIQAIILLQPAQHLRGGVLQGLVQGTSIATCKNPLGILAARPVDLLALEHTQRHLHVHGDLDARSQDLAIPLLGVAVAQVKERALGKDGEIGGGAHAKAAVIHVPAVLGGGASAQGLPALGSDPETAQHGLDGYAKHTDLGDRLDQGGHAAPHIHAPIGQDALRQLFDIPGVHHVRGGHRAVPPVLATRRDALDLHGQRIARRGALDVEGPRLRVAPLRHLIARGVVTARIDCGGDEGVPVADVVDGLMAPERIVVMRWLKAVFHLVISSILVCSLPHPIVSQKPDTRPIVLTPAGAHGIIRTTEQHNRLDRDK